MLNKMATSCWDSPTMLIALRVDADRYVRLANALLEIAPESWNSMVASLVISCSGEQYCEIRATCGSTDDVEISTLDQVRELILQVASDAIVPNGTQWIGIWVDYDVEGDRMVACIRHGGPVRQPRDAALLHAVLNPPEEPDDIFLL